MDELLFNAAPTPRTPTDDHARYARVAVERGIENLNADDALVYRAGQHELEIGDRVEVPLGRATTTGVVVALGGPALLGDLPAERVRPIAGRTGSRLPPELIGLAEWMSAYYCCPLGMVLASMVPTSVKREIGRRTRTVIERPAEGAPAEMKLPPATAAAWERIAALDDDAFPIEPRALAARLELSSIAPVNRLVKLGLLTERTERFVASRSPFQRDLRAPPPPPELTDEQRTAVDAITPSLGSFAVHLLHGITGSGKTEVYLHAVRAAAEHRLGVVVLVPEIALTPQTSDRFTSRFADLGVAVLHSGLSAGERHRQWARAASGEARVVVGARSAVFAPVPALGLIVVDEEHDTSYKQDQLPRYNARDVAIKRAQLQNAAVILGSATPSLESYANAIGPRPRYRFHRLTRRVAGGALPRVEVIDLARQPRRSAGASSTLPALSQRLRRALRETLDADRQAILLLNRRGFSTHIACPDRACGWTLTCHHCDAAMILHRSRDLPPGGVVRCHHCLAEQIVPRTCPLCAKRAIRLGVGTQRLEQELHEEVGLEPERDLVRVDSDSMRSIRDYFEVLDRFARRQLRVLLGTQMLAKGLDFPGVGLVGVINADTALGMSADFRSAERTFQLVSQVAGRAGRSDDAGLVIVQTIHPDADAIRLAADHDYDAFAARELRIRRASGLPPATRMARIVSRHEHADRAEHAAQAIAGAARDAADERTLVAGPMPCAIARIADHFRFGVEITAPSARALQDLLASLRAAGLLRSDARTAVDVDPVSLL